MAKIIVLTPVKNEDWILDIFLSTCSLFADAIIIADQLSTDRSEEICNNYEKVILIQNKNENFNEDERQIQLIDAAREFFPDDKRILIALDADEIMSGNVLLSEELALIKKADYGTSLYFEKPTFLNDINHVIRYQGNGWPLGFVDNGIEHKPAKIHSTRLPIGDKKLILKDLKILHYGLIRPQAIAAKLRFYSCLENIKKTKGVFQRRLSYPENLDINQTNALIETTNSNWIKPWTLQGIYLDKFITSEFYWHDLAVLDFFKKYGYKKFKYEDIWYYDWGAAIEYFKVKDYSNLNIAKPTPLEIYTLKLATKLYTKLKTLKAKMTTTKAR